jgi:NAD(P)-dependent dehydrogenase (short-subunit alcohol dehydrogenase family)
MAKRARSHAHKQTQTKNQPLAGQVAVVAGATRGAGRGVARGLGEAGATVYCTGRSVRGNPSPYDRPETIEETAEMVTAAGGTGIAVRVDHTVESEVQTLFERVQREQHRLDVLVNSIAGEDKSLGPWSRSFWKMNLDTADVALRQSLLSHLITAKHAAALMVPKKRGLIVEVTEGDMLFGGGNIVSTLVKTALKSLAVAMAEDLRKHKVAVISITPGFLRSETMLQHFGVTESTWQDAAKKDKNFLFSETPLLIGRAVAALAADEKVLARSGDIHSSWEVAREFELVDADGRRVDWGEQWKILNAEPQWAWLREALERHIAWLDRLAKRGRGYLPSAASSRQR